MQRIEVKNFGPIRDINLEIKDYMVFIGPQASGKSTLAKLIYFFWKVEDKFNEAIPNYLIRKLFQTSVEEIDFVENWKTDIWKLFFEIFPAYKTGIVSFEYSNGRKIILNIANHNNQLFNDIVIGSSFLEDIEKVESSIKNSPDIVKLIKNENVPLHHLLKVLSLAFILKKNETEAEDQKLERIFIPSGRGILSLFSNSISIIDNNNLDYFNENYIKFANGIRKLLNTPDYSHFWNIRVDGIASSLPENIFSLVSRLSFDILKGYFFTEANGDGIISSYSESSYFIPLKNTSSGQQESAWLINSIQYLLYASRLSRFDVIIEEPEAHLYPSGQRDITKLITLLANHIPFQVRLIVTTHSPYVLATLNNSIKAFSVSQIENKSEEVNAILNKEFWINPENLFVGFMNKNEGEDNFSVEDIFDAELGLINHDVLDHVSDDIIKQFDELLDIQYSDSE